MALRPPQQLQPSQIIDPLDVEILAEKAVSLGHAGEKVEKALARLHEFEGTQEERRVLLKDAAECVYAYFIQRELCGLRRHHEVIREYGIPNEVLVRLGGK